MLVILASHRTGLARTAGRSRAAHRGASLGRASSQCNRLIRKFLSSGYCLEGRDAISRCSPDAVTLSAQLCAARTLVRRRSSSVAHGRRPIASHSAVGRRPLLPLSRASSVLRVRFHAVHSVTPQCGVESTPISRVRPAPPPSPAAAAPNLKCGSHLSRTNGQPLPLRIERRSHFTVDHGARPTGVSSLDAGRADLEPFLAVFRRPSPMLVTINWGST